MTAGRLSQGAGQLFFVCDGNYDNTVSSDNVTDKHSWEEEQNRGLQHVTTENLIRTLKNMNVAEHYRSTYKGSKHWTH